MAWFTEGRSVNPTAAEARSLWDDEPPTPGPDVGVFRMVNGFRMPSRPPIFTGWVESGTLRSGQSVLLNGRSGFARGVVGDMAHGRDYVKEVSARAYISLEVRNVKVRLEILGLDEGCTLTTT